MENMIYTMKNLACLETCELPLQIYLFFIINPLRINVNLFLNIARHFWEIYNKTMFWSLACKLKRHNANVHDIWVNHNTLLYDIHM